MHLLDENNLAEYLRDRGVIAGDDETTIRPLGGGVSNVLFHVRTENREFVVKQAREQLRTAQEWRCSPERIWREIDTARACRALLERHAFAASHRLCTVPEILHEDRSEYAFIMSTAPSENHPWKEDLLAGRADLSIANDCGTFLGALHGLSEADAKLAATLGDRTFFEELRIAPYYRRIAEVHAELAPEIDLLIDSTLRHADTLVHGDFSPKNLLVGPDSLMLIDFEVGHFGDPAFDTGFLLTHLVLKTIHAGPMRGDFARLMPEFWNAYTAARGEGLGDSERVALEERTVFHMAGCMLARIDGKSPVEYLTPAEQGDVRDFAYRLFRAPPETVDEVHRMVE